MNKIRITPAGLGCPIVLLEELIALDDYNVRTAPIIWQRLLEFVQSSKNITDADSEDENEMNYAVHVPTSSELRNVMKSMCSYLDTLFNDEMNNKMDDIDQFIESLKP
ncbi:hypothetical protein TNCV_5042631 [Trichonephila clavipes]|nr:hypothetical protein TNCV_5042631 [Trichonephila clavipes]